MNHLISNIVGLICLIWLAATMLYAAFVLWMGIMICVLWTAERRRYEQKVKDI